MKVFILITLYVLIAFVIALLFIIYDYKDESVFKDVDEYIEYRIEDIVKDFFLGMIWPASLIGMLFVWSLYTVIKFILSKVNKEED